MSGRTGQWDARPGLARALRFGIFAAPLLVSILFTWGAGRIAPPESLGMNRWLWIACVFVLANVLLVLLRKATSRLLPLVALMKLTLVFPDNAPSRTKATLRQSSSRSMLRDIQAAKADNAQTPEALYADYLVQLLKELNNHDRLTRGHSERVRAYSEMIGEEIGLSDDEMNKLRWSALLHDVGKLSVPSEILNSPGRPTDEEWKVLSGHPAAAVSLLEPLEDWLGEWIHSADQHHCRWDGKGYPYDLAGTDISLAGRLVAIADAYDVMTSTRSYKKPLPVEVARQELTDCAGGQFDPTLVRAFLRISLGRLRFVGGPLAWLANLTGSFQIPVPVAGSVTSTVWQTGVAAAGMTVAGATGALVEAPPELLSFAEPIVVAFDTAQTTMEDDDQAVTLRVTSTGSDLVLTLAAPENGTVTLTREPARRTPGFSALSEDEWLATVTYSPAPGFQGIDRFSFQACDGDLCDTAEVIVTVVSTNEAPTVTEDEVAVDIEQAVRIDVLANDADPDGDVLDVIQVTPAENGTVSIVDGQIDYVPNPGFTGIDTFSYTIEDPEGEPATTTVTVTVVGPPEPEPLPVAPEPPTAGDDDGEGFTTSEDVAFVTGSVLANDTASSADAPLVIAVTTQPVSGSLQDNGDGTFWYSPFPDFNGEDFFEYTIASVEAGVSEAAVVSLTVLPVADAPVAVDDQGDGFLVDEGQSFTTANVTANDTDVDGDLVVLSVELVAETTQGAIVSNGDGTFDYTPDDDATGTDSFSYVIVDADGLASNIAAVTIAIAAVNDAPVAVDDDGAGFSGIEDTPFVTANVLDNDTDVDSDLDPDSITIVQSAAFGDAVALGDGTFRYTPAEDMNGTDSFTYTITDADGATSEPATVTIIVLAVNDGPIASDDAGDDFSTDEDTPFTTPDVTANDTEGESEADPTTVEVADGPDHGSLVDNGDGTFTYTPDLNFNGIDTFTYAVADDEGVFSRAATVTIVVRAVNDPVVLNADGGAGFATDEDVSFTTANVLANDVDPDDADVPAPDAEQPDAERPDAERPDAERPDAGIPEAEAPDGAAPDAEEPDGQPGRRVGQQAAVLPYTVTVVDDAAHGTLDNNGDGTFGYTPGRDFNGTDTFTYTVTDGEGVVSAPALVSLTVNAVNDAPVAVADRGPSFSTVEDTAFTTGDLTANDTDEDSPIDASSITVVTRPSLGELVINADGTAFYSPDADANGVDSFTYTITDADGAVSIPATVTIDIAPVNDAPTARSDSFETEEDLALTTGDVTLNDADSDSAVLPGSVTIVANPSSGSATANGDGTFDYTPDANFNGTDSFSYTITDADGAVSNEATVTIEVIAVNDVPVAADDAYETFEDLAFTTGNVTSNDSDIEDTILDGAEVEIVDSPSFGTLTPNGDGTFEYSPDLNANGADSFTYLVRDSSGAASNAATVVITVRPGNDPPVAADDGGQAFTLEEDSRFTTPDVSANDRDIEDASIDGATAVVLSDVAHGALVSNGDGTFDYTPDADFNGTDSFTYIVNDTGLLASNEATVTITVTPVNDLPVAADDAGAGFVTEEDQSFVTTTVLANDSDVEDGAIDPTSVAIARSATNGNLEYDGAGRFKYTPDAHFFGTDSFRYTVTDADGAVSNEAMVTIEVTPVNDFPIARDDAGADYVGSEDTDLVTGNVLANDSDVEDGSIDPSTINVVAVPTQGRVVHNGDGTFTYTPDPDTNGVDTFAYVMADSDGASSAPAVVTVEIAPVNDVPVAQPDGGAGFETAEDTPLITPSVLANDSDIEDAVLDPATISIETDATSGTLVHNGDGTFTYTPFADTNGTDTFRYTISDASGAVSQPTTVTLVVTAVNDAPVANNDTGVGFTTNEDVSFTTDSVVLNDTDTEDGTIDPSAVSVVDDVTTGTLVNNGDGTFTYTPAADANGTVVFTYVVTDSTGVASAPAEVTITVQPINDAPVASDDHGVGYTTAEDVPLLTANILVNDTDLEDGTIDASTIVVLDPIDFGTLVSNGDGTFDYTPDLNFNGDDSFTYRVEDSSGASSGVATVTLSVVAGDDPPVAVDDSGAGFALDEDMPLDLPSITANDSDPEDGTIEPTSVAIVTQPANGTLDISDAGIITYIPNQDVFGVDSFTYKVSDTSLLESNVATVTLEVRPVNDPPVAASDSGPAFTVAEDESFTTPNVVDNDTDVEDGTVDPATAVLSGVPVGGTVVNNGDGTFEFTAADDFVGNANFAYTVEDADGATSIAAEVIIVVTPVNDPPVAGDDGGLEFTVVEDESLTATGNVLANDTDVEDGALSPAHIEVLTQPAKGQLVLNADGTFSYEPDPDEDGSDSFLYRVADSEGAWSNPATVTLTIVAVNDAPVAADDSGVDFTTDENTAFTTGSVVENDSDVDDPSVDASTVDVVDGPSSGALINNGDGTFDYEPTGDFNGEDTFTYTVTDASGATSEPGTVTITVVAVNDPPIAVDDSGVGFATLEDTGFTTSALTANDTDIEDGTPDPASIEITVNPDHGLLVANGDGTFVYTPERDFHGSDTFTYRVSDSGDLPSNEATVTIEIDPVNDAPEVVTPPTQDLVVAESYSLQIDVNDVDNDLVGFSAAGLPPGLSLSSSGRIAGIVPAGAEGTYDVTVNVTDNGTPPKTTSVTFQIVVRGWQASDQVGAIAITEILAAGTGNPSREFVEITNVSSDPVDLTGWFMFDFNLQVEPAGDVNFGFPATDHSGDASVLEPGDSAVIWLGSDEAATNPTEGLEYVIDNNTYKLGNTGEDIWLLDTEQDIVDYVALGTGAEVGEGPPAALGLWDDTYQADIAPVDGVSHVLTPHGVDGNTSACWEAVGSGDAAGRCPGALATYDTDALGDLETSVGLNNNAFNADAGGPYAIVQGDDLTLDASGTPGSPASYAWDIDDDGDFDDGSGVNPTIAWEELAALGMAAPGDYTIAVDVPGALGPATATLTVGDDGNAINIAGASTAVAGTPYTFVLSDDDLVAGGVVEWTINWGDGTIETVTSAADGVATATHTYTGPGLTYDILVSAKDSKGVVRFDNNLLVPSFDQDKLFVFDSDGNFVDDPDTGGDPIEADYGPDGLVYVSSEKDGDVRRHDPQTGAYIDTFVPAGTGGMTKAEGIAFGPYGDLFVGNEVGKNVLRFDGATGALVGVFADDGLTEPYDIIFDANTNLYVGDYSDDDVRRFSSANGALIDVFVDAADSVLKEPEQMAFGPDGNLYVSGFNNDRIMRYSGVDGAFIDTFIDGGGDDSSENPEKVHKPTGLAFGPDGNLYIADFQDGSILRFNPATGAFIDEFVAAGEGGLTKPAMMTFSPSLQVTVS